MTYTIQVQVRNTEGQILAQADIVGTKICVSDVMPDLQKQLDENLPDRASLITLVGGKAVRVQSARDRLFGLPGRLENEVADYAAGMATHILEKRKQPQHQLIPPPLHFQKLYFGADSDAANIAIAAMLDRLRYQIGDDRRDEQKLQTWDQQEECFWENLYELSQIFGEIGDTNIKEEIWTEFKRQCDEYNRRNAVRVR